MDGGMEESVAGRGLRHDRSQTPVCFILISFFFSFLIYNVQVNYYGYNYKHTTKIVNGQ